MARRGHVPTKVERSLYRGITGITGITGTSNTGNTDHKYIGGNTDFVPKEGIFLLFITTGGRLKTQS